MSKLDDLAQKLGREVAERILEIHLRESQEAVLTIVANRGVHHLPDHLVRGEIYYASEGSLDFSSVGAVKEQYEGIIRLLSAKLKSQRWEKIYLVPFGHNSLSMQIKLLVYRVTHLETIDIFYNGNGGYYDLEIKQRDLIVSAGDS